MVLVPETRFEAFLAKIAGETGPDLEPITRIEAFLDDIADGENNLEPRTRIEYWLQKIAENGGGTSEPELRSVSVHNATTHTIFPNSGMLKVNGSRVQKDGSSIRANATSSFLVPFNANTGDNVAWVINMASSSPSYSLSFSVNVGTLTVTASEALPSGNTYFLQLSVPANAGNVLITVNDGAAI